MILGEKNKDPQIFTICSHVLLSAEASNTNNANTTRMAIHGEGGCGRRKSSSSSSSSK